MGSLNVYFGLCVMILALSVAEGDKACEKEEFQTFYKEVADILVKRDRESGVMLTYRQFVEDRKSVYECGEFLLSSIRTYDAKNETALTEEEKALIRDEYSLLVSWIAGCGTVELWAGEKKGGTIASAIYHFVGGKPEDVIGPRNEDDPLTNIVYPK